MRVGKQRKTEARESVERERKWQLARGIGVARVGVLIQSFLPLFPDACDARHTFLLKK